MSKSTRNECLVSAEESESMGLGIQSSIEASAYKILMPFSGLVALVMLEWLQLWAHALYAPRLA